MTSHTEVSQTFDRQDRQRLAAAGECRSGQAPRRAPTTPAGGAKPSSHRANQNNIQ